MKLIQKRAVFIFFICFITASFGVHAQKSVKISVSNPSNFDRQEVVGIKVSSIAEFLKGKQEKDIRVIAKKSNTPQTLQWLDNEADGLNDELLFYVNIPSKSSEIFTIEENKNIVQPEISVTAYSRFVPERTDDYAWENDKVAFRTYGPDAQKRVEEHRPDGTLTSGIDLWLKRTNKPIINSWYKGNEKEPGYYHKDRGEGYDPYQVGPSRGTGGTGIWKNDSLLVSKNFVSYRTIAAGPLRTVFELTYNPYSSYDVSEKKRISLDVGSNFSKFEVSYQSKKVLPNYTIGISLHENKGTAEVFKEEGVFAHHERIDGVYLGEGIVIRPQNVQEAIVNKSKVKDQSNLLVLTKPGSKVIYYAGFAWGRSGQAATSDEWIEILKRQAEIMAHPLILKY
jgi:hypothetical protein